MLKKHSCKFTHKVFSFVLETLSINYTEISLLINILVNYRKYCVLVKDDMLNFTYERN